MMDFKLSRILGVLAVLVFIFGTPTDFGVGVIMILIMASIFTYIGERKHEKSKNQDKQKTVTVEPEVVAKSDVITKSKFGLDEIKSRKNANNFRKDEKMKSSSTIIIKEKETVKIRCRYCGTLVDQGVSKCPKCGIRV